MTLPLEFSRRLIPHLFVVVVEMVVRTYVVVVVSAPVAERRDNPGSHSQASHS